MDFLLENNIEFEKAKDTIKNHYESFIRIYGIN